MEVVLEEQKMFQEHNSPAAQPSQYKGTSWKQAKNNYDVFTLHHKIQLIQEHGGK